MKIGDKLSKFLVKKHFIKDFNIFLLSIFRADGKLEHFTISINGDFFTMSNEITYPREEASRIERKLHISKLEQMLLSSLRSLKIYDYKRLFLAQGEGSIWLDLYEKD